MNSKVTSFANWVIKYRWLVIIASFAFVMAGMSGLKNFAFNNDYHVFFDEGNKQVEALDALEAMYAKNDNVFLVVEPKDRVVFKTKTMQGIQDLETALWQTKYSTRVDALSNYQHTRSVGDDMFVESLFESMDTPEDIERIKKIALNEPLLKKRLISEDGEVTAINITVDLPLDNPMASMEIMAHVDSIVTDWKQTYPEHNTYVSGIVGMNSAFGESSQKDMGTLVPAMYLIIILVVLFTTRSIVGGIITFVILIFSIFAAMGWGFHFGVELNGPSTSAPIMILTLAVADSIHLLVTILQQRGKGLSKNEAIVEGVRLNFMPVLITSLTTIIGFLTLNFVEGGPFHDLGNITAIGVGIAFILSVFFLPAMMSILPWKARAAKSKEKSNALMMKLADFVINNRKSVLLGSIVATILISAMSYRHELNNEFVKFFDTSVPFRQNTDFIEENLTGIYTIEYSMKSGDADGISDPKYLTVLDNFEKWYKSQPEVEHVNSFSEIIKRVNRSMHGDSNSYYSVPNSKQAAAQFLLLYEMSLPYGLDLNNQINVDKSESKFTVTLKNVSSNQLMSVAKRAEDWLRENAPEHMFSYGISTALMFSHITKNNMHSMLISGFGALILISFILIFALRSFKYGTLSLIPNVAPIAIAFGIWGIFVAQINMSVAVVLGMTLGIVVDDTVHLLSKYIRARREMGMSAEDAIRYSFSTVGRAVIVTTIALTAGFSILMFSSFGINSDMGKITAITIAAALILDLIMLPAILLLVDGKKNNETKDEAVAS